MRRSRAEAQADRDEAEKRATLRPQPRCTEPGCGALAHLPCHVCGRDLCAAHGHTRLLVAHCASCAASEVGTFATFLSLPIAERVNVVDVQPIDNDAERDRMTKKSSKTRAHAVFSWGRAGSTAEAYKRIIMAEPRGTSNAKIHARVVKELGAKKAGPLSYVAWYRSWLVRHGYPTAAK